MQKAGGGGGNKQHLFFSSSSSSRKGFQLGNQSKFSTSLSTKYWMSEGWEEEAPVCLTVNMELHLIVWTPLMPLGCFFFPPMQIRCYVRQVLEGICYLHRNGILHLDIKVNLLQHACSLTWFSERLTYFGMKV